MKNSIYWGIAVAVSAFYAFEGNGASTFPTNWISKASLPQQEYPGGSRNFGVAVLGGRIYAVGGYCGPHCEIATVLEYDPTADEWTKKADMLQKRYAPAAAVVNGRLFAMGGADESGKLATVEEYDPVVDKWTMKASMKQPRYAFSAVTLNGKIYAIGGAGPGADPPLAIVEAYDPAGDKWAQKADMPDMRMALAAAVANGRIYVVGGRNDAGGDVLSVFEYTPASDQWAVKSSIPTQRAALAAVSYGGKVFALGGGGLSAVFEQYDVATDTWSNLPDLPTKRQEDCFAALIDTTLYVFGGYNEWTMEALTLQADPIITTQPVSQPVPLGASMSFTVVASGGTLTYQWFRDGSAISGATDAAFNIPSVQRSDAGNYRVAVSNSGGSVSSVTVALTVTPVLDLQRLDNGFVVVQVRDPRALVWRIEESDDFSAWKNLGTASYDSGLGVLLDIQAAGKTMRFYRAVAP